MTTKQHGYLTRGELMRLVGKRCDEVEPGCVVCAAWLRFDLLQQMRFEDENTRIQAYKDGDLQ